MRQRVGDTVIYKGETRRIISIGRGLSNTVVFDNGKGVMGNKVMEGLQSPYTPTHSLAVIINDNSNPQIDSHINLLRSFRKINDIMEVTSAQGNTAMNKIKEVLSKPNSLGYILLMSDDEFGRQSLCTQAKIKELINATASSSRLVVVLGCTNANQIDESGLNANSQYSIVCLNRKDSSTISSNGRFGDRFLKWVNSRFSLGLCGTIRDTLQESLDTVGLSDEQTQGDCNPIVYASGDNMMNAPFA